jgi:hypothetical protein
LEWADLFTTETLRAQRIRSFHKIARRRFYETTRPSALSFLVCEAMRFFVFSVSPEKAKQIFPLCVLRASVVNRLLSSMNLYLSPASLELSENSEKNFYWLPLSGTAANTLLGPSATVRPALSWFFIAVRSTATKKGAFLCELSGLCEKQGFISRPLRSSSQRSQRKTNYLVKNR